jgi:hypothetical protein
MAQPTTQAPTRRKISILSMLRQFRHILTLKFYADCSMFYRMIVSGRQFQNDFDNRTIVIRDSKNVELG